MFNYPVYKQIKERIKNVAQVFMYLGQYNKGQDNTSYKVPAIYVEMPPNNSLIYYGRRTRAAKGVIRIHYISYAPYKNHDNSIQDAALADHYAKLKAIDALLQGWNAANGDQILTQQLIASATIEMRFINGHVVSVISYGTELYAV